jgi:hypothetical protein
MLKVRRAITLLLALVLVGIGIFCGLELSRWTGFGSRAGALYSTPVLLKRVQALSELVTVKYVMEKAIVWNDPPQGVLGQFFAGDNHILLLAQGVVKAGVDLSQLKPEDLQVQGKTIVIRLPSARITDAYLDDSQTKVVERTTGFLRAFDKDLEQNIRHDAVADIRSAAWRSGIRKDAEERARAQLKDLFLQLGFEEVEFELPGTTQTPGDWQ